jgi:hypothetical protein
MKFVIALTALRSCQKYVRPNQLRRGNRPI